MKNYMGRAGAVHAFPITESDVTEIRTIAGVWVGGAGNLVVDMLDGTKDVAFNNVAAGTFLPIQITKVKVASTATAIVGLS